MTIAALQAISVELPGPFDSRWALLPGIASTAPMTAAHGSGRIRWSAATIAWRSSTGSAVAGHDMTQKRGTGGSRAAAERRSWIARTGAARD
jgi:hypothetical protein